MRPGAFKALLVHLASGCGTQKAISIYEAGEDRQFFPGIPTMDSVRRMLVFVTTV